MSCFPKTDKDLINAPKEEPEVAINDVKELSLAKLSNILVEINWFSSNKMIDNPDKFKSVTLIKNKSGDIPTGFSISTDIVFIEKSAKLLGIHLDNRLNFNLHINTTCKSASNQLNALVRLKKFLSFEQKKILVNSFVIPNFDYCPLAWFISSLKKLTIYKHVPFDIYRMTCVKTTSNVRKLRNLCKEIFKFLKNLNPVCLKEFFYFKESNRPVREKYKLNLQIPKINQ